LRLMSDESGAAGEQQRELLSRLRAVVDAKDAENAVLRQELGAERELRRRLELRIAELERRLGMDSSDSGTPSSKERIGAKEARRARRQESERERRKDRSRGGQPGHPGKGLQRDPDPGQRKDAEPPAQCRRCRAGLEGAVAAEPGWAQVWDVEVVKTVTEWALPGLTCPCCGTVTIADPPPDAHAGSVSYGPVLNAAAVPLTSYGNVPPERAARVMGMLLGVQVSAGWADKACSRLSARLAKAGFDEAMLAALTAEPVLAADETPVNVLDRAAAPQPGGQKPEKEEDPEEKDKAAAGAPHVLIVRTPDERLTLLQAIGSRRKGDIAGGIPGLLTGSLITDGYTGYQHLPGRLAGIQQCCRTRRHPRRPQGETLAATTARHNLMPGRTLPVNGHEIRSPNIHARHDGRPTVMTAFISSSSGPHARNARPCVMTRRIQQVPPGGRVPP
jgi:transposase